MLFLEFLKIWGWGWGWAWGLTD